MAHATGTEAPSVIDEASRTGASAQLGELFREHGRTVYSLCLVLVRDAHEAEDAAQQAFLRAFESLRAGSTPWSPDAWLLTIARNECLDRLRKRARHPQAALEREPATEGVEEVAERNAALAELCAALDELPPRQRDALLLHELCGLSYVEIARMLDLSVPAVESLLFRGRRHLEERTDALRLLPGLIVVPLALHEGLAQAIPGFAAARLSQAGAAHAASGSAAGSAGGGGSLSAAVSFKLASLPLVAKLATTAVVVAGAVSITHTVSSAPEVATGGPSLPQATWPRPALEAPARPAVGVPGFPSGSELPAAAPAAVTTGLGQAAAAPSPRSEGTAEDRGTVGGRPADSGSGRPGGGDGGGDVPAATKAIREPPAAPTPDTGSAPEPAGADSNAEAGGAPAGESAGNGSADASGGGTDTGLSGGAGGGTDDPGDGVGTGVPGGSEPDESGDSGGDATGGTSGSDGNDEDEDDGDEDEDEDEDDEDEDEDEDDEDEDEDDEDEDEDESHPGSEDEQGENSGGGHAGRLG